MNLPDILLVLFSHMFFQEPLATTDDAMVETQAEEAFRPRFFQKVCCGSEAGSTCILDIYIYMYRYSIQYYTVYI